jgi:DNA gyrase subunit A
MHESGLSPTRPFKKSATVVGDVLGRYHPHGDASVYDALVRMVQDFSLRYPLISGQGNFGSIDGDSAAAYRYTEARLAPLAMEMLSDIDKETVDFSPNYDDRLQEPTVLPAKVPNLLVNGSSGIAVGMSTNVPPHNLKEVARAVTHLLDHPDCTVADLMRFLPGPDFPTGGIIVGRKGIRDAYETGRGRVVMRARVSKEQKRGGREQLVVTEIPYATSKTRIIEQIADLVKRERITDISDLRDESDRDGIRLVIELKRGAEAIKVLDALYRWTSLQATFGVITLALDGGVPKEFSLKQLLEHFREHRIEVIVRRSQWELARARDEVHVLEGLLIALKHIDAVVKLIRSSRTRETASAKLQKQFKLTERQAEAILNMRLVKLTALETKELKERLAALEARIIELEAILADPARQIAVIRAEIEELAERYGDARRTQIVDSEAVALEDAAMADEEVVVSLSRAGFIQQVPMALYRRRASAGRRLAGMDRYENDFVESAFVASTRDVLMFFTDDGRAYWLAVVDIPEAGAASRGRALQQLLDLPRGARVVSLVSLARAAPEAVLVFATAGGTIKRTLLEQFGSPRVGGEHAINHAEGDRVLDVRLTDGVSELVLVSSGGRAIRFPESEVSLMGRAAQGVRGMRLREKEELVGMLSARRDAALCTITRGGYARRIALDELNVQRRGGLGTVVASAGAKPGPVVAAREVATGDELMLITSEGRLVRVETDGIGAEDETQYGTLLLELAKGEQLLDVARAAERRRRKRGAVSTAEETDESDEGGDTDDGDAELEIEGELEEEIAAVAEAGGAAEPSANGHGTGKVRATPTTQFDLLGSDE